MSDHNHYSNPLFQEKSEAFKKFHAPVDYRDTWQIFRIMAEFVEGYQLLGELEKTVTIFGSARSTEETNEYIQARKAGFLLGKEGYAVITGGGPGVMEASNRGAMEAKAISVGLSIQLPEEQIMNAYINKNTGFNYFFIRKVMLVSPAEAGIFFPGGYGTMDELFELVDLIELGKIKKIPVIVVGIDFWKPILDFLHSSSLEMVGAISKENLDLIQMVDTAEEAVEIIKNSKVKKVLCNPAEEGCGQTLNWRIFRIMSELVAGFEFLSREVTDDITVLGTKSVAPGSRYYQAAEEVANHLGNMGYMVVTGGGPGIMEAANKGAKEAGVPSIGFSMRFDEFVKINPYVTKSLSFNFPFIRKMILTVPSNAFIFFPGGIGTLHQLFEVLTLMKTKKMQEMKVILYGKEFWEPLDTYIKDTLLNKYHAIIEEYANLYQVVDSVAEVLEIIPESHKK